MDAVASSLNAHVLVLNKHWLAVRVTDARRAFSLLVRDLAEVIHVENGEYTAHDFESWSSSSQTPSAVPASRRRQAGTARSFPSCSEASPLYWRELHGRASWACSAIPSVRPPSHAVRPACG